LDRFPSFILLLAASIHSAARSQHSFCCSQPAFILLLAASIAVQLKKRK
jgi:hypothetical protein